MSDSVSAKRKQHSTEAGTNTGAEDSELFRCITESHPLPVWVADEDTGEIIYESLSASEMLGRKWDPDNPQFISDHYVDIAERERIKDILKDKDRVVDHEFQMRRVDGSIIWVSSTVRRGTYHGRSVLIAGTADITERKEREDLFGFLVKNHPMPVWMNDSHSGNILYQSDAAARLFGWDKLGEGKSAHVRAHFASDDDYKELAKRLEQVEEVDNYETVLKNARGEEFWAAGNLRRMEYQGRDVVLSGIADITSQKERDAEIRFIVESHPLPMWMNDVKTGELIFESEACARMFGRERDPERTIDVRKAYVNQEDRKKLIKAVRKQGSLDGFECAWHRENGEEFWAKGNVKLLSFQGRDVLVAGIMDVTEQKQRENEQIRARELLSDAIDALSEGFALYDEEGCLVFCNSQYKEMNHEIADVLEPGLSWEDLMRVSAERGIYADAVGREDEWVNARLEGGIEFIQDFELKHADDRWYSVSVHPTDLGGFVVTRSEITERKQMEEAQKEAGAIVHQVLDSCPIPIQMSTIDDAKILYRSPACSDLFGEVDSARDFFADKDQLENYSDELIDKGAVNDLQLQLQRADGSPFWASVSARVIDFRGEKVVVSSGIDLSEHLAAQDEIKRMRDLLTDAIESLSEGFALYDTEQKLVMCNQQFINMNNPTADILKPGMRLADYLETGVKRGQFLDAVGCEDEWLTARKGGYNSNNTGFEFRQSDGRHYSASNTMTREGGFVVTRIDVTDRKKAEEAQKEAHEIVREVVESCPAALEMQYLPDGGFLFRSPEAVELLGTPKDATESYVDLDDRPQLLRLLERKGEIKDCRVQRKRADGTPFWASVSSRIASFRGKPVSVSTIYDLTEREELEADRERAGQRLIDAIQSLSEGFALYGPDDRLVMCNDKYKEMHHMCADKLEPGVNWFEFLRVTAERHQFPVPEGDIDAWLAERALDRSEYRKHEFQHTDGNWFFVSTSPTREGGFVVTRADITERKLMEEKERKTDAVVRNVLAACPAMITMTHVESGDLIYGSPATEALFGEVKSVRDIYATPSERDRFLEMIKKDGAVEDFEYDAVGKDGDIFRASVSGRLIDYQGEQVIVSLSYDLTDRISMLEELERQKEFLHQSEKLSALGELLAGVAHELNNPLSVVVGQSLLLTETAEDEKTRIRAQKIGNAADRCARIVKTFLAMARQQPTQTTNVDVNEVIESSLEVAGYSLRAADVSLSLNLADSLPFVWGDADQLSQVMINLIVNAGQALADYDGKRKIKIVSRLDPRKKELVVKVADTGPGIPANIRSRVFEPFFTTKEVGSGTGIGLAFCHRIAETHGGTIRVAPNPGGGTIFFLRLPVSVQNTEEEKAKASAFSCDGGLPILVIDDESDVREFIAEVLRNDGHDVTVATSGTDALHKIAQNAFAVVLSDLKMPNLDGPKLFEAIKSDHEDLVERLGFITGDTMSPNARKFLSGSNRPYLDKPIRPSELRELVAELSQCTPQ
ncbi:MAG: PAS-domain containing protein [Hyphomicrobiales bacterium]